MKKNKTYNLKGNTLELYVKKSPVVIRAVLLILAFLFVAAPLLGMILSAMIGNDFHIGYLMGIGIFSLFSFFFLRLFLWNTYGKEVIEITDFSVSYYADYHYFKGNQQQLSFESLTYDFVAKGFEEEEIGNLLFIATENDFIESGVNLPIRDLIEVIELLEKKANVEI